ncbi:ABC transporter permease [Serpentinicella alkaliphila]|uniref:Putative ABC transport system permease protein n=1 Tax=Serpentinicella alkaliphila TaxID=1734049 RepID=A0A4R2THX9_9FIRM|nr:ABC transporter permease [Serpentinicella alkaliphila]QUH24884.1 ABC transporter permease [Serpentinicella alkaliphila]TCQ01842.1 putative ABC transport system permease protein [Serpentinicella alkaliphila]
MILFETFIIAISSIWSNKLRSSLTMLGLIIGILSVVVITTLGNAAQADMTNAFDKYGKGKLNMNLRFNADRPVTYRDYFSAEDIEAINLQHEIVAISPELRRWMTLKYKDKEIRIDIMGVNDKYDQVETMDLISGRFLTDQDLVGRRNVIIIDERTARNLFGTTECIGEIVTLTSSAYTTEMMIIGVDKMSDSALINMAQGDYSYGFMPLTLAARHYVNDRYPRFMIQAVEGLDLGYIGDRILNLLERRNKERAMYRIFTRENEFSQVSTVITLLTSIIGGIAAISLFVGGIGIMNIMLVSVTERTREIGIRKALGARRGVILLQFLVEAVILSFLGGAIGLILGLLISLGIVNIFGLSLVISVKSIAYAFIFSIMVGVIFGVYPANKASKLDPIDALRYE